MSKLNRQKKLLKLGMKYLGFFTVIWYNISLFFTKRKGKGFSIKTVESINEIPEILGFGERYKKDPKIDVFYHPRYVQMLLETGHYKHFDCEDYSGFWNATIQKSNLAPKSYIGILMMVIDGKISGHAICVYQDDNKNWWWGDYNYPKKIQDKWDWANDCASGYGTSAFACAMIEVKGLKKDDTPILGKYVYHEC